jgi:AraC family transcriptional regulator of adaptative response / DNA-3-methyladenine glycosylase II
MAEVALAAGFNSIRRFNATFQSLYQRPPRELRRSKLIDGEQTGVEGITLKLAYAPPYDWDAMIDFLGARAIRASRRSTTAGAIAAQSHSTVRKA